MRVIGLGLSSQAARAEVRAALAEAGAADALAVLASRVGHPALAGLALHPLPETALRGVATPTQSPRILDRFGCGSVAEALALVLSGGTIVAPRQQIGAVTWAIADAPEQEQLP